jgi:hypothetical protein
VTDWLAGAKALAPAIALNRMASFMVILYYSIEIVYGMMCCDETADILVSKGRDIIAMQRRTRRNDGASRSTEKAHALRPDRVSLP